MTEEEGKKTGLLSDEAVGESVVGGIEEEETLEEEGEEEEEAE